MHYRSLWLIPACLLFCLTACNPESAFVSREIAEKLPEKVDFNFHVKPILTDRCFSCHGPDEKSRKANLRFDTQEGLFGKTASGKALIDPGDPEGSLLIRNIYSNDPEVMMPPPASHLVLSESEKAVLTRWVAQGAEWKKHWAFITPEKTRLPRVKNTEAVKNAIDRFVVASLEKQDLSPAPAADPEILLRRVYLDLTGLPPTVQEIDAFLQNPSDKAYEQTVDRLMQTDAFAERMAMEWLDVARYADSHGYHADGWRSMWPWRDWVISAFKENMPFDQFATWQIAGDLLPQATEPQILATGFNRNHQISAEGGIVDEEYRLEYVFDRIHTTATAFLGLTLKCAQCHDHKFDPVSQKEFYQFSAFFDQVDELGMNTDDGNCGPTLLLYPDSTKKRLQDVRGKLVKVNEELRLSSQQTVDIADFVKKAASPGVPPVMAGVAHRFPMERIAPGKTAEGWPEKKADGNPAAGLEGEPHLAPGKHGQSICLDNEYESFFLRGIGQFERHEPFSVSAWVKAERTDGLKTVFAISGDKNNLWRGWDVVIDTTDELFFRLIHALPHDQARIRTKERFTFGQWQHVTATYDGSGKAEGMQLYLNGKRCATTVEYDQLARSILPVTATYERDNRPLRLGKWYEGFSGEIAFLKGCFDEVQVYPRQLSALEAGELAGLGTLSKAVTSPELQAHVRLTQAGAYRNLLQKRQDLVKEETRLAGLGTEVQVMDNDRARPTHVLGRGVYTEKGEVVTPGVPQAVLPWDPSLPANRLGLARWIFDAENPLTARVTVNRYWQLFFGKGIVATPHDFGYQGALPSHPELLDWLAVEFREKKWDVRHLVRLIVTSATYRQSSGHRPELQEIDPQNILLARGPAFRLPAEMIRDNALAASGLLVKKVGGEPVKPYQPENIWGEKSFFSHKYLVYVPDSGENLYRRTMYTILKRTSPHPALITLDATDRSYCIVQRPATNTPLQALVLLNDPTYTEAARVLAVRMQQHAPDLEQQLTFAFRQLTGRKPRPAEMALMKEQFEAEKSRFAKQVPAAKSLLATGEFPPDQSFDPATTAALAMVNSTLINHDAFYVRR